MCCRECHLDAAGSLQEARRVVKTVAMSMSSGDSAADWTDRGKRLSRIVDHASLAADFPLLKVIRMSEAVATRLEAAVLTYLWHSVSRAYPQQIFTLSPTFLATYATEILALPNRTPNGVIMPRRDTCSSFNLVQQTLADAMEAAGLIAPFALLQMPCNVRVIGGQPDAQADKRNYSSAKMHTDVWNGEPVSTVLFNIPALGDPQAVDLRFFEPSTFPNELRRNLSDYALGKDVTSGAVEYPVPFELGCIYVSDALSLHQTIRRRPGLRVSLDFRGIARDLLGDETAGPGLSKAVYAPPELWRAGGTTAILASGEPLDAFQRRQAGENVQRATPSLVDIDGAPSE
jgi:hypothetical protein